MQQRGFGKMIRYVIGFALAVLCSVIGTLSLRIDWEKYISKETGLSIKHTLNRKISRTEIVGIVFCLCFSLVIVSLFQLYHYTAMKTYKDVVLVCFMFYIAMIDYKFKLIPSLLIRIMFVVRVAFLLIEIMVYSEYGMQLFISAIGGLVMSFIVMILGYFISRKSLGMGDVRLLTLVGFYLGSSAIYAEMLLAFFLSAIVGLILIALKKMKMRDVMPFAPYVAISVLVVVLVGF